jgi:hypothetical protein
MRRVSLLVFPAVLTLAVPTACGSTIPSPPPAPGLPPTVAAESAVPTPVLTPSSTTAPTTTAPSAPTARVTKPATKSRTTHTPATSRPNAKDCQTGSCLNAAHGLSQKDVIKQRDDWLAKHPGWCPAGSTGAVAPC